MYIYIYIPIIRSMYIYIYIPIIRSMYIYIYIPIIRSMYAFYMSSISRHYLFLFNCLLTHLSSIQGTKMAETYDQYQIIQCNISLNISALMLNYFVSRFHPPTYCI